MGLNRVCGEKITPKYLLTLLQISIKVSFVCMSTNNLILTKLSGNAKSEHISTFSNGTLWSYYEPSMIYYIYMC